METGPAPPQQALTAFLEALTSEQTDTSLQPSLLGRWQTTMKSSKAIDDFFFLHFSEVQAVVGEPHSSQSMLKQ